MSIALKETFVNVRENRNRLILPLICQGLKLNRQIDRSSTTILETFSREINTTQWLFKKMPQKKALKSSSREWLVRHINDPYVKKSRYKNYRARSAFKLIEIDDKYRIIKPGMRIIDCGAAPGAWTQVAVERSNSDKSEKDAPTGVVIAVDLLHISPILGAATFSQCDVTKEETKALLYKELNGSKADLVMSDMAPNASGVKDMDHDIIMKLGVEALKVALNTLTIGGVFLVKVWDGRDTKKLEATLAQFFNTVKRVKPPASRDDSAEVYVLALDFKGMSLQVNRVS